MKRHWIGLVLWFWPFHARFGSDAVGGTHFEPQISAFGFCSSWRGLLCPQTPNLTRIFPSQMEEGVGEIVESAFA
jgi:hypothetical protein